jgi:hypothetical protein
MEVVVNLQQRKKAGEQAVIDADARQAEARKVRKVPKVFTADKLNAAEMREFLAVPVEDSDDDESERKDVDEFPTLKEATHAARKVAARFMRCSAEKLREILTYLHISAEQPGLVGEYVESVKLQLRTELGNRADDFSDFLVATTKCATSEGFVLTERTTRGKAGATSVDDLIMFIATKRARADKKYRQELIARCFDHVMPSPPQKPAAASAVKAEADDGV